MHRPSLLSVLAYKSIPPPQKPVRTLSKEEGEQVGDNKKRDDTRANSVIHLFEQLNEVTRVINEESRTAQEERQERRLQRRQIQQQQRRRRSSLSSTLSSRTSSWSSQQPRCCLLHVPDTTTTMID